MHRLRLFAININDVRDIFGADPTLAARLRDNAASNFAPKRLERGLLEKIGPLFARQRSVEVDRTQPLSADVDRMLGGGHIPAERHAQSWQLLLLWLEELAAQDVSMTIDDLEHTEFELARAGLPSTHSLRSLAARELGISLRPLQGQIVGYAKHEQVVAVSRDLRKVHNSPPEDFAATITSTRPLLALLEGIAQRPQQAFDLVVIEVSGAR